MSTYRRTATKAQPTTVSHTAAEFARYAAWSADEARSIAHADECVSIMLAGGKGLPERPVDPVAHEAERVALRWMGYGV